MVLPMSPSYDRYGRTPIGMGERRRRRRAVNSTAPERGDSTNADARRLANMTVNTKEQSEPLPLALSGHQELTIDLPAQVAKVD